MLLHALLLRGAGTSQPGSDSSCGVMPPRSSYSLHRHLSIGPLTTVVPRPRCGVDAGSCRTATVRARRNRASGLRARCRLERRHPGHQQLAALDDVGPDRRLEQLRIAELDGGGDRLVLRDERRGVGGRDLVGQDDAPGQDLERLQLAQQHLVAAALEHRAVEPDVGIGDDRRVARSRPRLEDLERIARPRACIAGSAPCASSASRAAYGSSSARRLVISQVARTDSCDTKTPRRGMTWIRPPSASVRRASRTVPARRVELGRQRDLRQPRARARTRRGRSRP